MAQPTEETYDVVVIGAGAVGENVADRASRTGLSVAVVEQALVGGECSYWACMPSKALLRPGAALAAATAVRGAAGAVTGGVDVAATLATRDAIVHGWDDGSQVDWLEGAGLHLVRGRGRLAGPRRVEVADDDGVLRAVVHARHAVVVATGSAPTVPDVPGLAEVDPWTSRDATAVRDVPGSLAVVGGGVVGAEMATAYADMGARVTLLVRGDRLLPGLEPFAGEAVAEGLAALGVDVRLRTQVVRAARVPGDSRVRLHLGDGGSLEADRVLLATGRRPRTVDLGVETVGLAPGAPLETDDAGRVTAVADGWLWAAGDVTGRAHTTHQGKHHARRTGDVIAARFGGGDADGAAGGAAGGGADGAAGGGADGAAEAALGDALAEGPRLADGAGAPQVVFTRPEVAAVGLTEEAARRAGREVRVVDVPFASTGGATVFGDDAGAARLVVDADREVLVGATFVGPEVAEMLHAATIAVVGEVPLRRLWQAVPPYPTRSEIWLRLLEAYGL
ncbi:MAG: NAD(P)/FAD-dependent oxidoreductase [Actinomycetales bacterium]|nr:NAD(P)/FAD-dependent oxidoreductase [Actinomycetales bacterium]